MPSKTASVLPMLCAAVLGLVLIAAATSRGLDRRRGRGHVPQRRRANRSEPQRNDPLAGAREQRRRFGKLGLYATDGKVDAQPLYLSSVPIPAFGVRNVLYVATEHDSVYAFDADTGAILWRISVLGAGETPSDQRSCGQVVPEIGITSTPVIDRSRGPNGVIYVVGMSKNGSTYFQRLHALDITTGAELFGGPRTVQATFPGSGDGSAGGVNTFDPKQYEERSALLLVNGRLITAWTSHCDIDPYTGWIMAYDPATLAQTAVLNVTPNGSRGAFWMAGAGPAADPLGNIYLLDGNGTFGNTNDTVTLDGSGFPTTRNFGNAFLKVSTAGGLAVADYFATFDTVAQSNADADLGSGGTLVFPDFIDSGGHVKHLAVGAGKDGHIYVVDRDAMGKWNASSNQIYQDISGALAGACSRCRPTSTARCTTAPRGIRSKPSRSPAHASRPRRRRNPRACSRIRERRRGSPRPARRMQSCGRWRTRIPRCCTPTTPRTWRTSCTTRARPPAAATPSAPATSSSRRRSSTAACMSARRPASPSSETSRLRRRPTCTSSDSHATVHEARRFRFSWA